MKTETILTTSNNFNYRKGDIILLSGREKWLVVRIISRGQYAFQYAIIPYSLWNRFRLWIDI